MKILVVEDDQKIAEYLSKGFTQEAFTVDVVADGESAFRLLEVVKYDCIVLDLMIPKIDGMTLLKKIRFKKINTPILILSAKHNVEDRVNGLDSGADDYLIKPFSFAEVLARINALLRRKPDLQDEQILEFKGWKLDRYSRKLSFMDKFIDLKAKEFSLMELFLKNQQRVLSKSFILDRIWNIDFDPQTNVVDVLVCRLRNQLESVHPQRIVFTVRGVGYVLK